MAGWPRSQTILTIAVWLHGTIGLHYWLRLRPGYAPFGPGSWSWRHCCRSWPWRASSAPGARRRGCARKTAGLHRSCRGPALAERRPARAWVDARASGSCAASSCWSGDPGTAVAAGLAAPPQCPPGLSGWAARSVPRGLTILEASRVAGMPHAAVCGGGRAARPVGSASAMVPNGWHRPTSRSGACWRDRRRRTRLACQTPDRGPRLWTPLMPATAGHGRRAPAPCPGPRGRAGDRSCSRSARLHRPVRGPAALRHGLHPQPVLQGDGRGDRGAGGDKFIGDGIMALFGLESDAAGVAGGARSGARHGPGAGPCSTAILRSSSRSRCAWASACIWAR